MVNTRGQQSRVDGTEASLTASGNRGPRRNAAPQFPRAPPRNTENVPTLRDMYEQLQNMQDQLAQTQHELSAVRAERDELRNRRERSGDSQTARTSRGRQNTVEYSTHSRTATSERPVSEVPVNRHVEENRSNRGFQYKAFLDCKPKEFKGDMEPVASIRWLRDMEIIFEACDCPEDKKVVCASRKLSDDALDWWETTRESMGAVLMAEMSWSDFKDLFQKQYCNTNDQRRLKREFLSLKKGDKSIGEYSKLFMEKLRFCGQYCAEEADKVEHYVQGLPAEYRSACRRHTTLRAAIEESKLFEEDWKERVKRDDKSGFKRKFDGSSGSNKKFAKGSSKGKDEKKVVSWCDHCKTKHSGACSSTTLRCNKCGNTGHLFKDCTDVARCFKCKEAGHRIADCPKMKADDKKNDRPKPKARAFQITAEEAKVDDDVVCGTFLINSKLANVLFDSGANRSFVSSIFAPTLEMTASKLV